MGLSEQELAAIAMRNQRCLVVSNVMHNAYDSVIESVIREDVPCLIAEVRRLQLDFAALRFALVGAMLPLEALMSAVQWELAPEVKAEIAAAVQRGRAVLEISGAGGRA